MRWLTRINCRIKLFKLLRRSHIELVSSGTHVQLITFISVKVTYVITGDVIGRARVQNQTRRQTAKGKLRVVKSKLRKLVIWHLSETAHLHAYNLLYHHPYLYTARTLQGARITVKIKFRKQNRVWSASGVEKQPARKFHGGPMWDRPETLSHCPSFHLIKKKSYNLLVNWYDMISRAINSPTRFVH